MRPESETMVQEILQYLHQYADVALTSPEQEAAFNELALQEFRFQFTYNLPYKKFCQARRKAPLTVKRWQDIPPVPIQAYKEVTLACEPPEEAEAVFMTSGTTNAEKRGRNYHPTLAVWDASMVPPFKQFVMPDRERMTIFVISPAEDLNQNSSLSRYLSMAVKHCGTEQSQLFFKKEGLDMEGLAGALQACENRGEPVLLLGATFSYVHFLDYCREQGLQFHLPAGSRVFDTGGLKGQAREVTEEQLYADCEQVFGVERSMTVNMYGMTELSSQIYSTHLRTKLLTGTATFGKQGPAWVRTLVLDANTLEPLPDGQKGVLAHYDLANWNSSLAILTEDIGYQTPDGLVLLGRAKGTEARGCSIAIDQLMQANKKV